MRWSAPCSAAWLRAAWRRSNWGAGIEGLSSLLSTGRIAEGRIAAYKDQPQQDDQDEEEILRAAAEIRQRRVAATAQGDPGDDGNSHALSESRNVAVPSFTAIAST